MMSSHEFADYRILISVCLRDTIGCVYIFHWYIFFPFLYTNLPKAYLSMMPCRRDSPGVHLRLYWKLFSWNVSMAWPMASTFALTSVSCAFSRCSSLLDTVLKRRNSSYSFLVNSRLWVVSLAEGVALLLRCWIKGFSFKISSVNVETVDLSCSLFLLRRSSK